MSKKSKDMSQNAKVGFGEHLAYGIGGGFATNAVNLFIGAFLIVYLTEIMKINPGVAAGIVGVSKFLDGISDLIAGRIIDKTHSKFGKARVWLLRMIPCTVISLLLLYLMPSSLTGTAQIVYVFVMYNLVSTGCYTFSYVAFMALNGLMTTNQKSRGLSSDPSFSPYGDRTGWIKLLVIWMIVGMLAQVLIVFGTRERVIENAGKDDGKESKKAEVSVFTTLKALFKNKYWIYNIIIAVVIQFLMGATGSTTSYYMTYVVGDAEFYQVFSTANSLAMLGFMLVGFPIMAKLGKRNAVLGGLIIRGIGTLLPLFSSAKPILLVAGVIGGAGYGIAGCAFASIIQDTLTYGEWKNGYSMIGMGNAANSFAGKIGNSLGTIVLGLVMNASGYVAGAAQQTASALMGFKVMFIFLPAAMIVLAIVAAALYDLDKIYPQIAADLAEGKYAPGVTAYGEKKES